MRNTPSYRWLRASIDGEKTLLPTSGVDATHSPCPPWSVIAVPGHVPAYDGLRGIAVLLTMLSHILPSTVDRLNLFCGITGVSTFFTMSGFLTTGVFVAQQYKQQPPALYRHLATSLTNRLVRLYPALFFMVLTTALLQYLRLPHATALPTGFFRNMANTLMYAANIEPLAPHVPSPWKNTWSVAVQEQWIFIWALALPLLLSLHRRVCVCLVGLALLVSLGIRMHISSDWHLDRLFEWDSLTLGQAYTFLAGALLRLAPTPHWMQWPSMVLAGFSLFAWSSAMAVWGSDEWIGLERTGLLGSLRPYLAHRVMMHPAACLMSILVLTGSLGGNRLLEWPLLRFLGRISYSWYLWQVPLLIIHGWPRAWHGLAYTCLSLAVSTISTLYIEEPLIAMRRSARNPRSTGRV